MSEKGKKVLFAMLSVLIILSLIFTYYYFQPKDDGYLTVKEAMVDRKGYDWFLPNWGLSYKGQSNSDKHIQTPGTCDY